METNDKALFGLPALIRQLASARFFDDAAACALKAMLGALEASLRAGPFADGAQVLRGIVHLRPGDGYRRLWTMERDGAARAGAPDGAALSSATAWRWVSRRQCAVAIDVELATAYPEAGETPEGDPSLTGEKLTFQGNQTILHLRERSATHVYVVPLRAPGERARAGRDTDRRDDASDVCGMISLEIDCRAAIGHRPVDAACGEGLQLMAHVAAPHLVALPLPPAATPRTDGLLPVLGAATADIAEALRAFAQLNETVLLLGPTGAGKSRLAQWCHAQSPRAAGPFETVDLLSVPAELQAGTLFGWKKGAFTSADKDNPGTIGRARGGTVLIDEIDKLSLETQAVLLHVLETRRYQPLGGTPQDADVRFIVATNADLRAAIREGRFREDLFYRVNVLPIRVPALDDRTGELPGWAAYMVARCDRDSGGAGTATVTEGAVARLRARTWPGNLRELDNIIRRSYALARAQAGASGAELALGAEHIERALAFEDGAPRGELMAQLATAARGLLRELERGRDAGLSLEAADVLRALVIVTAVHEHGGKRDEALLALGKEQPVKNRNHHREVNKAIALIRDVERALGASGSVLDGLVLES